MSNVRLKNLGRALGMEDDGEMPGKGVELEVDETGAPIKGDETVEAEELAVDEASDEVAEEMDAGEDLVEAEQTLESIYAALRDASETGRGISQESAQFMTIAIEGIRIRGKRLTAGAVGVPSCESFGSSNRAMSNTNLSMEGIGDVLRKVWEWIKTQIGKIVAKIKTWYKNILGLAPRLKKRAEAIKKKADGTSGSTDETTIGLSVHKQLQINKKNVEPAAAKTHLELVANITKEVLSKNDTLVKGVDATVDKLVSDDAAAILAHFKGTMVKGMQVSGTTLFTGDKGGRYDKDSQGSASVEVFGGKMYAQVSKQMPVATTADAKKYTSAMKLGFDNVSRKATDLDSNADYKVLSTGDVGDLCDTVIDICEYIMEYEKTWDDRQKAGDKITKACDKLKTRVDKDKEKNGDVARDIKDAAQAVYSIWAKSIARDTNVIGYGLTTGRCILTWCERSLSTYK